MFSLDSGFRRNDGKPVIPVWFCRTKQRRLNGIADGRHIGCGGWGTALAIVARRAGCDVLIWAHEAETVADINQKHRNETFLPGIKLDKAIEATERFNEVANCDMLLMVTPAQHVRFIAGELAPFARDGQPLVLCSKGIEQTTGKLMSQIVAEALPAAEIAVLSGPSFASEIAKGLPAAVTLATEEEAQGAALAHALSHPPFRCYWSEDVVGCRDRRSGEERLCHRRRHRRRQEVRR